MVMVLLLVSLGLLDVASTFSELRGDTPGGGGFDADAPNGHDEDRDGDARLAQGPQQAEAVQPGHRDVQPGDVAGAADDRAERLGGVGGDLHRVAGRAQIVPSGTIAWCPRASSTLSTT
jgi:hypothetical protein